MPTCCRCGAPGTVRGSRHCARCLLVAAAADADVALTTGADEAPPCELLSVIGDSSRATTFLGEQTWPLRRLVALRLFKDGPEPNRSVLAAPRVPRHPAIAAVLEAGWLAGRSYVITPYLGGGMLPQCYDRHRLGAVARVDALVAIVDAIAFAHARGMTHGRLTPSNLLCESHPPYAVSILDFEPFSRVSPDQADLCELKRVDLAAVTRVAETLLRSPLAQMPARVDLVTTLSRVASANRAGEILDVLESLAASL